MSDVPMTRAQFQEALRRIQDGHDSPADLTARLRQAILDFASETPDNVNCTERIEVGGANAHFGLKVRGRDILFSEIAHALEEAGIPDTVRRAHPALTEADWDAFKRMTTLLYVLLERPGV